MQLGGISFVLHIVVIILFKLGDILRWTYHHSPLHKYMTSKVLRVKIN